MDFFGQMWDPGPDLEQVVQQQRMSDNAMTAQSILYLHQRIDNLVARIADLEAKLKEKP